MRQETTQRAVGQFDAAVLEINAEEAEQLAAVESAMQRLRVSLLVLPTAEHTALREQSCCPTLRILW